MGNNTFYLNLEWEKGHEERGLGWALRVHAFTDADNAAAHLVTARPHQTKVDSDVAQRQVRSWLAECALHHCCPPESENILPTRVIEIDPPGSFGKPRLLTSAGKRGQYAALSYCWGVKPSASLSHFNHDEYSKTLNVETLPQTF